MTSKIISNWPTPSEPKKERQQIHTHPEYEREKAQRYQKDEIHFMRQM